MNVFENIKGKKVTTIFGYFQNGNPKKVVRFPEQPDAVEVVLTVNRDDSDEPMSFQVAIFACFEIPTTTTPVVTTSSVETSSVPTTSSSTSSTSSTSSGPVTTSSVYTSSSSPGITFTSSTRPVTTSSVHTSSSSPGITSTSSSSTSFSSSTSQGIIAQVKIHIDILHAYGKHCSGRLSIIIRVYVYQNSIKTIV
jgi:hypothetical protein